MRTIIILMACCFLISCSDAFVKHDLEAERIGDCNSYSRSVNMISNINGERYVFFSCIDDEFDGKNYTVERMGDSIVVNFPKTTGTKKALYKITIDMDVKPRYSLIILDEREVHVAPSTRF